MLNSPSHPYWLIRRLVEVNEEINRLNFSFYKYTPQVIEDNRKPFSINRDDFLSPEYVMAIINETPGDSELAIHSNVRTDSNMDLHIPMIDMSTSAKAHLKKLQPFLGSELFESIYWFSSGRSFHGYGTSLMETVDWVKLMGSLLLSNQKGMPPTTDPRWIGHRLIAGYSALRWTRNTDFYINTPSRLLFY